ncbi:MAG: SCP2 sterol-binding domain-containing protein [Lachnospiraceae bacterium]|nr:SCP2 sterol-binding domain-containing protein [Lachnospiraceae bacterium]
MKVNIYYGGRGIIDDPTLYVINKMQDVLEELNVKVERFNLYELKNSIITLPASLNECDGIILATTVEWYGIGGYLMQFLDACWLYGNKEKISKTYMCPIVMSTTSGEREAKTQLSVAWEILGGLPVSGLCGYVSDTMNFELNKDYASLIEKKAENIYRTISQRTITLPSSNQTITKMVDKSPSITLSPQETEQLSEYASDESYVQQQKEDISELTSYFKNMLDAKSVDENTVYISDLTDHFVKDAAVNAVYKLQIKERKKPLIIEIKNKDLNCYYGNVDEVDVNCKLTGEMMNKIISGNVTFQRAFMSGEMQVKGDFKILRQLDQMFVFTK